MGIAWRQPSRSRHRQPPRSLTTRDNGDTRSGHIPTPPRPRPDRARPALPQKLAATFLAAQNYWCYRNFPALPYRYRAEQGANRAGHAWRSTEFVHWLFREKMAQPQFPRIPKEHADHFAKNNGL